MDLSRKNSKLLTTKIVTALFIGATIPSTISVANADSVPSPKTMYYVNGHEYADGTQEPSKVIILGTTKEFNAPTLNMGDVYVGVSTITYVPSKNDYNFQNATKVSVTGNSSITAKNLTIFTTVAGEPESFNKAQVEVNTTGNVTVGDITNTPPTLIIPNKANAIDDDQSKTLNFSELAYRDTTLSATANNITTGKLTINTYYPGTPTNTYTLTANNTATIGDITAYSEKYTFSQDSPDKGKIAYANPTTITISSPAVTLGNIDSTNSIINVTGTTITTKNITDTSDYSANDTDYKESATYREGVGVTIGDEHTDTVTVGSVSAHNDKAVINIRANKKLELDSYSEENNGKVNFSVPDEGTLIIHNFTSENAPARSEGEHAATPLQENLASAAFTTKNTELTNLKGDNGRILLKNPGATLTLDNVEGAQEYGLTLDYANAQNSDKLVFKNGTSKPQSLAITDTSYKTIFDAMKSAETQAIAQGKKSSPIIPFAKVENANNSERTFIANTPVVKWNAGQVEKDVLYIGSSSTKNAQLLNRFKEYFSTVDDNSKIYFVSLKKQSNIPLINSTRSLAGELYRLATYDEIGMNDGTGVLSGEQSGVHKGLWAEMGTSKHSYDGLYSTTPKRIDLGYTFTNTNSTKTGIAVSYEHSNGTIVDAKDGKLNTSALVGTLYTRHGLSDNRWLNVYSRFGRTNGSFSYDNFGGSTVGKAKTYFAQVSGEYTQIFNRSHGVYFAPQAQLTITGIRGNNYITSNGVSVTTPGLASYRARLGVVLGKHNVGANNSASDLYVAANIFHEYGPNSNMDLTDSSSNIHHYSIDGFDTWGSVGIGYRHIFSPKSSLYVDYAHTIGTNHQEGNFHLGGKFNF